MEEMYKKCDRYETDEFGIYNKLNDIIKYGRPSMLESELSKLPKESKESVMSMYSGKKKLSGLQRFHYRHKKSALESKEPLLFIALLRGKFNAVKVLLSHGVNMQQQDGNGWNVVHYFIAISYFDGDFEKKAVQLYKNVKNSIPDVDMTKLLLQEDLEGLRPIEMALHYGCILLFEQIINTPGYYLAKTETRGLWKYIWYDITDYENCGCKPNRRDRCLLMLLSNIDKQAALRPCQLDIIKNGMLYKWTFHKLLTNVPFILLWLSLRLVSFFMFFAILSSNLSTALRGDFIDGYIYEFFQRLNFTVTNRTQFVAAYRAIHNGSDYTEEQREELYEVTRIAQLQVNASMCDKPDWYSATSSDGFLELTMFYIILYGIFSMLFDLIEKIISGLKNWSKWHTCFGKEKELVVTKWYYRACQFLFCLLSIVWGFCYAFLPGTPITEYGVIPTGFTSVWTILYFVQMLPAIGHFVNSIQRMLGIMFQFVFVYMLVLSPYPHLFKFLLTGEDGCSVDGFANIGEGIYTTFKVMLNMVEFTNYEDAAKGGSFILHIIYVFLVAILLVNFLIALLSSSVSEIVDAGDVIMMLQRLSVVTLLERRMTWFLPVYYKLVHRLTYKCDKGRIFIVHCQFSGIEDRDEREENDG